MSEIDSRLVKARWGYASVTDKISDIVLRRPTHWIWAAGFALTFCLTLGFKTVDSVGGLTLKSRPVLLATVVGIVFVGRLLLNLFWWNGTWKMPRPAWRPERERGSTRRTWRATRRRRRNYRTASPRRRAASCCPAP